MALKRGFEILHSGSCQRIEWLSLADSVALCGRNTQETARTSYGNEMARKIHLRIDQLEAADSVQELILNRIGRCHGLTGDRQGQYAMDLAQPYRLIFKEVESGIQIVMVMEIVDYH